MIKRRLHGVILNSIKKYPIVGILGSRQVGKTTLSKMIKKSISKRILYLDLELPSDLNKLAEPELYLSQFTDALIIIDEIQRMPSLFPLLRALVDKKRISGRFLILGSASPDLIKHACETLAGRIIYHELSPFNLTEVGHKKIRQLWIRGGYPLSFLSKDEDSFSWRESFISTYLQRDIPQLGIRIPSAQLRRFWTMLAHLHGQLWNASNLAKSLGISAPTAGHYLDILEDTFIVRRLQPYHFNIKKRLIKSPKVYVRDSGLLHALSRIRNFEDLHGHPSMGSSWEGFVIEQILGLIPQSWTSYFYRTNAGAEVDLLLFDGKNRPVAIEIKYSSSPKVERGYWNVLEDLSCKKGFVVYPGTEAYPLGRNVSALPVKNIERILD
jgi:predicted AAA+ superfamily ATPase